MYRIIIIRFFWGLFLLLFFLNCSRQSIKRNSDIDSYTIKECYQKAEFYYKQNKNIKAVIFCQQVLNLLETQPNNSYKSNTYQLLKKLSSNFIKEGIEFREDYFLKEAISAFNRASLIDLENRDKCKQEIMKTYELKLKDNIKNENYIDALSILYKIIKINPKKYSLYSKKINKIKKRKVAVNTVKKCTVKIFVKTKDIAETIEYLRKKNDTEFRPWMKLSEKNLQRYKRETLTSGSGIMFSKDGYILTAYHLFNPLMHIEKKDLHYIDVKFLDGTIKRAKLIGYSESIDIAILKINKTDQNKIILGNSDRIKEGDKIAIIGNPVGIEQTIRWGYISTPKRMMSPVTRLIQLDIAVNPGDSGGPLINDDGHIIGICTSKIGEGIGFAVPMNYIKIAVHNILNYGEMTWAWLGLLVDEYNKRLKGVKVNYVFYNEGGALAGIQKNDIIVAVNDMKFKKRCELLEYIMSRTVPDLVKITIKRNDKIFNRFVSLTTRKEDIFDSIDSLENTEEQLYLLYGFLRDDDKKVIEIIDDSIAEKKGLKIGDKVYLYKRLRCYEHDALLFFIVREDYKNIRMHILKNRYFNNII